MAALASKAASSRRAVARSSFLNDCDSAASSSSMLIVARDDLAGESALWRPGAERWLAEGALVLGRAAPARYGLSPSVPCSPSLADCPTVVGVSEEARSGRRAGPGTARR